MLSRKYHMETEHITYALSHRTTGCFDDRLLTMITDTGFYVPWRVGYNFRLAKVLEKPLVLCGGWVSTLVSVERSYRNKLRLYLSQIKPRLIIISEVSQEKSQKSEALIATRYFWMKLTICKHVEISFPRDVVRIYDFVCKIIFSAFVIFFLLFDI